MQRQLGALSGVADVRSEPGGALFTSRCLVLLGEVVHREPRAAGVFAPGFAPGTLQDVTLARSPSYETLLRADTLELGKVEDVSPKRLELTPAISVSTPVSPSPTLPETVKDAPADPVAPANKGSTDDTQQVAPVAPAINTPPAAQVTETGPARGSEAGMGETRHTAVDGSHTGTANQPPGDTQVAPELGVAKSQTGAELPSMPAPPKQGTVAGSEEPAEEEYSPDMYEDGSYWKFPVGKDSLCDMVLRIDRFQKKLAKKAKETASAPPEVVKLWGSQEGRYSVLASELVWGRGKRLHTLLLEHGDMKSVDLVVKREAVQD